LAAPPSAPLSPLPVTDSIREEPLDYCPSRRSISLTRLSLLLRLVSESRIFTPRISSPSRTPPTPLQKEPRRRTRRPATTWHRFDATSYPTQLVKEQT